MRVSVHHALRHLNFGDVVGLIDTFDGDWLTGARLARQNEIGIKMPGVGPGRHAHQLAFAAFAGYSRADISLATECMTCLTRFLDFAILPRIFPHLSSPSRSAVLAREAGSIRKRSERPLLRYLEISRLTPFETAAGSGFLITTALIYHYARFIRQRIR